MRAPIRRIGQKPSVVRRQGIPLAMVMGGSLLPMLPFIFTVPLMPPFGLLALLGWRSLHRALWPIWMPVPLGLFDDLFSGQPLGSAMLLWTLCFLALDAIDRSYVWRSFREEWAIASLLIALVILLGLVIANLTGGNAPIWTMLPQIILSILVFPLVTRLCAHADQHRF